MFSIVAAPHCIPASTKGSRFSSSLLARLLPGLCDGVAGGVLLVTRAPCWAGRAALEGIQGRWWERVTGWGPWPCHSLGIIAEISRVKSKLSRCRASEMPAGQAQALG